MAKAPFCNKGTKLQQAAAARERKGQGENRKREEHKGQGKTETAQRQQADSDESKMATAARATADNHENVWYQHKDVSWAKAVQVNTPLFGEKFVANYIPVTLR